MRNYCCQSLSSPFKRMVWVVHFFFLFTPSSNLSSWPLQVSWKDLKNASGITSSDLLLLYAWQFQNIGLCIRKILIITEKMAPRFWQFSDIQSDLQWWIQQQQMSLGWFILWKIRVGQIFLDIHFLFCKKSLVTISVTLSNFDHKQLLVRWFILRFFAHTRFQLVSNLTNIFSHDVF